MSTISAMRKQGNDHYKAGNYKEALVSYSVAIKLVDVSDADRAVIYNNRAACFLQLKQYEDAIREATLCLDLSPSDSKALFRRCQAYEALGQVELAWKDVRVVKKMPPDHNRWEETYWRIRKKEEERWLALAEEFRASQGAYCEMELHIPDDAFD